MQHAFRTTELALEERMAVERLLGRVLRSDETVEIVTHTTPELSEAEVARRGRSAARILELAKGKTTGGLSARDLIEEGRR